jgi:hypothetical protein
MWAREGRTMTEAEWLAWVEPVSMMDILLHNTNERKLRLFAVACCRHIWELLPDERSRHAVELAERFADGQADQALLAQAVRAAPMPEWPGGGPDIFNWRLVTRGCAADMTDPRTYVWLTAEANLPDLTPVVAARSWVNDGARFVPPPILTAILRCLFCNPLQPVFPGPWVTPAAVTIAQDIYDRRDFSALPLLADLLEEAGCPEQSVLDHCRQPGPHARGCWVVDLVLGKE